MKICKHCNKKYNDANYCPKCGSELVEETSSCYNQLGRDYKDTYGTWKVTTEGDCEGRSTTNLGTYTGHIDDIALMLKNKCYYSLNFTKTNPKPVESKVDNGAVSVSLNIDSNTWNLSNDSIVATMKELFKNRDVEIKPCNYFASFTIVKNNKEE